MCVCVCVIGSLSVSVCGCVNLHVSVFGPVFYVSVQFSFCMRLFLPVSGSCHYVRFFVVILSILLGLSIGSESLPALVLVFICSYSFQAK